MCQTLPAAIVAPLEALGQAILAIADQQRDASLAEQEAALLGAVRQALPALLAVLVSAATTGLNPARPLVGVRCPQSGGGQRLTVARWRPRGVQTTCGPLRLLRPSYRCRRCRTEVRPVDATLDLAPRLRLSPALEQHLIRLGGTTSFREAADLLGQLTGIAVAPETVRQVTEASGAATAAQETAAITTVQVTRESADPVAAAPGTLVVEADGAMLRYLDGWHEVKVGVVGGVVDGDLQAPSYVAAREDAAAFGPRLLAEAARRGALEVAAWEGTVAQPGLAQLRPVEVLGDGAAWIWALAADHFGERTEVVDFYHAAEHLWTVARALYGEGTPAATAWAEQQRHALRHQGVAPVLAALATARPPTAAAAAVLRRECGYFRTHAARMDYPAVAAAGLLIGSGAVEGSAKHVVQQRLKRPGQRWSTDGARCLLAVRARLASQRPLLPRAHHLP